MHKNHDIELSPTKLRRNVIRMAKSGNTVHIGCAFSIIEIVSILYEKFTQVNPAQLDNPDRNFFCLSKGHGAMAVYSALYEMGVLKDKHLDDYFKDGSSLKGLSDCHVDGVEISGGSLGQGITVAAGMAMATKCVGIAVVLCTP